MLQKTLIFYLEPAFRERAEAGKVNFINKIVSAPSHRAGFATEFKGNSDAEIAEFRRCIRDMRFI